MAGGRVATTDAGSIEERLARAGLPALPRMAWLEIDLDALVDNYRSIARLAEGAPAWPVVKADAYGHGVLPVARALESAGAPGFYVATFDEALQLRVGGIRAAVLVLYPVPPEYAIDAARNRIAVTAGDVDPLEGLIVTMGQGDPAERLDVQLELETGLGRGGFDATEIVAAAGRIRDVPGLRLSGLWSHLTNAADAERTRAQLVRFDDAVNALRRAGHELPRHVAASGGLLTGGVAALDGVRPGLALYGPHGVRYGSANWRWHRASATPGDRVDAHIALTAHGQLARFRHGRALVRERRRFARSVSCGRPPTASPATWRIVL